MVNLDKWAVNESLLQAYRSTFISSQSFLLAVGAILSGKSGVLLCLLGAVALLVVWFIWYPVVRARHLVVDYYKGLANLPAGVTVQCTESEYVHDTVLRAAANKAFGFSTNWRTTRKKLDLGMPLLFTLVWIALLVHEAYGS